MGEMGCAGGLIYSLREHTAHHPTSGPTIVACGPLLTVKGGYPLDWLPALNAKLGVVLLCESEDEARRSVHRVAEMGMDHVKLVVMQRSYAEKPLRTVSAEAAQAVVSEAHALGFKVLVHAHFPEDYRLALDAGVERDIGAVEEVRAVVVAGRLLDGSPLIEGLRAAGSAAAVAKGAGKTIWWSARGLR